MGERSAAISKLRSRIEAHLKRLPERDHLATFSIPISQRECDMILEEERTVGKGLLLVENYTYGLDSALDPTEEEIKLEESTHKRSVNSVTPRLVFYASK